MVQEAKIDARLEDLIETDHQALQSHQSGKRKIADPQFREFMGFIMQDMSGRFTRADFQQFFRNTFFISVFGFASLATFFFGGRSLGVPDWLLYPLVFIAGIRLAAYSVAFVHARVHDPNTTGWKWLDQFIDLISVTVSGWSGELFKRSHLFAHYAEIGILSKAFRNDHIDFKDVPLVFFAKPWRLFSIYLDKEFCDRERIDRDIILKQALVFYAYLALVVFEMVNGTYFLLVSHVLATTALTAAIVLSGAAVHSSYDSENTFQSNGYLYGKDTKGLYKIAVTVQNWLTFDFLQIHGIHHAYPQAPGRIIRREIGYWRNYLLEHYPDMRYCEVMTHSIHRQTLEKLPKPNLLDWIIQGFVSFSCWAFCSLIASGYAPELAYPVLEHLLVDYRLVVRALRKDPEMIANGVRYLEERGIPQAFKAAQDPSPQLRNVYKLYNLLKAQLAKSAPA